MKNKSKKFIIGIVLCAIGIIGLFGLFTGTEDAAMLVFGSAIFIVAGGILLFLDKKKPAAPAPVIRDIHAEAEEAKKNNDYYSFRVAGVTYKNGRKYRQAILRQINYGDAPFDFVDWTIEKYDFEGKPAVGIYANGEQIGSVPKDNLDFVLQNWDRIKSVYHAEISGGGTDDMGETINYGCEITLCLSK